MTRWTTLAMTTAALAAGVTVSGCGAVAKPGVDAAWIRLPAVPGRPAAAYFTIHGGSTDATLVKVTTPVAARTEMHDGGAGGMRPIAAAQIAAGRDVAFAPGGRHVMLFDPDPRLKLGAPVALTLTFADGATLVASARTVAAGDPHAH